MAMRFSTAVLVLASATAFMHADARNLHDGDTTTRLPQSQTTLPLHAAAPLTGLADDKNFIYGAGIGAAAGMGGFLGIPGGLPLPAGGTPLLGGVGGAGGYGGGGGASAGTGGGARGGLGGTGDVGGGAAAAGVPTPGGILPSP